MRRITTLLLMLLISHCALAGELDAWRESTAKTAILQYLQAISDPADPDFIPAPERVAVLDNDGTFWCERPGVSGRFQTALLVSQAAAGRVDGTQMPYSALIADDRDALRAFGWRDVYRTMNEAFAGLPVGVFRDSARSFVDRSRHPDYGVPFTDLYYTPMLELARLLEAHGFQVWIVTGSEQDFVRSFSESAAGIPPERVIGSWTPAVAAIDGDRVTLVRGDTQIYNGHEAKPGNIETRIGRRPVFAAGNSDNDQPMCLYAVTGPRRGLALWIHHDDDEREFAYDRGTERMAGLCASHGNAFEISMKTDWSKLYAGGIRKSAPPAD